MVGGGRRVVAQDVRAEAQQRGGVRQGGEARGEDRPHRLFVVGAIQFQAPDETRHRSAPLKADDPTLPLEARPCRVGGRISAGKGETRAAYGRSPAPSGAMASAGEVATDAPAS